MAAMPSPPRFSDVCVELLLGGTAVRFRATGSSMWPTIRDGDVITVAPARPDDVAVGDVVLYRAPRGLTAHRVMKRLIDLPLAFRVRGDAPGSQDDTVAAGEILGTVGTIERDGGPSSGAVPRTGLRVLRRFRSAIARLVRRGSTGAHGPVAAPDGRPRISRDGVSRTRTSV